MAELAPVGARRVLADEGDARSRLFQVNTVLRAVDIEVEVTSGDIRETRHGFVLRYAACSSSRTHSPMMSLIRLIA